jgi:hypothetical protein
LDVELKERFDAFRGTTKERIARKYGVVGVNVFARKPGAGVRRDAGA